MSSSDKKWETYEEVATYLLNQISEKFGIDKFEGKQRIKGTPSGTKWEIDAKGISENRELILVVECKRHTKNKINQEVAAGLSYRIQELGAEGGIIVSPLGIHSGTKMVAAANNIHNVILNENCTTSNYILKFLNEIHVGLSDKINMGISDRVVITITKDDTEIDK